MDYVFVRDLKIATGIGVFNWEKAIKQTLSFDIDLATDVEKAAKNDNIYDTVDYTAIADRLTALLENYRCELVETLADYIAKTILNEFNVSWLRLTIRKPKILPNLKEVGIVIERRKEI
jgi:dihydroneopterin aldolase